MQTSLPQFIKTIASDDKAKASRLLKTTVEEVDQWLKDKTVGNVERQKDNFYKFITPKIIK